MGVADFYKEGDIIYGCGVVISTNKSLILSTIYKKKIPVVVKVYRAHVNCFAERRGEL